MILWIIYDKKYMNNIVSIRMLEKAQSMGIDAHLFFYQNFTYITQNNESLLYYENKSISKLPDVALIRGYDKDIYNYLNIHNVKIINGIDGTFKTRDKYQMHIYASKFGISQPKTIVGDDLTYKELSKLFKSEIFIMKDRFGQGGENVLLIHNEQEFLNAKQNPQIRYIYQEYIEASKGHDVRLYIVGNKIFGPIERYSTNGDFRSNITQCGASKLFLDMPQSIKNQSLKFAHSLGLDFCTIDYLISNNNFLFCEANANAGMKAFFTENIDLQTEIMKYIKSLQL